MTRNESATCSSTAVTYGSHDTIASTLPSLRADAKPNCDQIFSMVRSSYFMPARRNTILKYSSDVCPRASPMRLPLRSATLPTLMPLPFRVTIPSGSSALSRVASFIMMPITLNGSPEWTALRKVVTLMSPICASPLCIALTMSVPVSTTFMCASMPWFLKMPFSAPTNIGRWPKLLPITTSSLGNCLEPAFITFLPDLARANPTEWPKTAKLQSPTRVCNLVCLIIRSVVDRGSGRVNGTLSRNLRNRRAAARSSSAAASCPPRRAARAARRDISIRRACALLYRLRAVLALGQGQRVARISRQAVDFRKPELLAHDVRAEHHGDHLVGCMPPAHAFASHPAIRRDDQPFGRNIFQRFADQGRNLIWALDLQGVVIDHADDDLLVLDHFADCRQVARAGRAGFERQHIGVDLVEHLEGRLIALDLLEHALL